MMIEFAKPDSVADLIASNKVALTCAKHGKVFQDEKIIKEYAIKMAIAFGEKKLAKNFENLFYLIKLLQEEWQNK